MNITARPVIHFERKQHVHPNKQQQDSKEQVLQQQPSYPNGAAGSV